MDKKQCKKLSFSEYTIKVSHLPRNTKFTKSVSVIKFPEIKKNTSEI